MLYAKTNEFVKNISVDNGLAGPLIEILYRLAEQIDASERLSASLISEYVRVHTKLLQMTSNAEADPVEELLTNAFAR